MIEVVNALLTAVVTVKKQIDESKKAREKFGKLAMRIERVRGGLLPSDEKDIETLFLADKSIASAITHFSTTINQVTGDIDAYINTSSMKQFFGAGKHKESGVDLDAELDNCMLELNTAMSAYNTAKAEQERHKQELARKQQEEMAKQQEFIAKQQKEAQDKQQAMLRKMAGDSKTAFFKPEDAQDKPHTKGITSLALLPNNWFASASADKTVKVWNLSNEGEGYTFIGHTGLVSAVVALPGNLVASSSYDRTIKIWNRGSGKVKTLSDHTDAVNGLVAWPNMSTLVSCSDDMTIRVWDIETGEVLRTIDCDSMVQKIFPLKHPHVCSSSDDKLMRIWNMDTGDLVATFGDAKFTPRRIIPLKDGNLAVSYLTRDFIKIWNPITGKVAVNLQTESSIIHGIALNNGNLLVGRINKECSTGGIIEEWDIKSGIILSTFKNESIGITNFIQSSTGDLIAADENGAIGVWNLKTQELLQIPGTAPECKFMFKDGTFTTVWKPVKEGKAAITAVGNDSTSLLTQSVL